MTDSSYAAVQGEVKLDGRVYRFVAGGIVRAKGNKKKMSSLVKAMGGDKVGWLVYMSPQSQVGDKIG